MPNFLEGLTSLQGPLTNFSQSVLGSRMQAGGAKFQAQGYRQAASSTLAAAEFNNDILEINTQRRLDALGRHIGQVAGQQRVAAAASGFASSSQSKLAVMDATLDQFALQIRNEAASLGHQQAATMFEAQSRATALETQARTTEFQQQRRQSSNLLGQISSASTLLTSIGGLFGG